MRGGFFLVDTQLRLARSRMVLSMQTKTCISFSFSLNCHNLNIPDHRASLKNIPKFSIPPVLRAVASAVVVIGQMREIDNIFAERRSDKQAVVEM